MPQPSKLNLPPVDLGGESLGQRIARIRKERGFTHVELAEKIGVIQSIVSALERDERKLSEMAVRFAHALGVSLDDLLGPGQAGKQKTTKNNRKVLRRLELIESLPNHQRQTVLKTIDAMLKGLRTAS